MEPELLHFLLQPESYPAPVEKRIVHHETHISHVFLTGRYVYKFKKSLKLPFLDFRSLESREYYCRRELELNRRYAPELYDSVVRVTREPHGYAFDGPGATVEFAVRMQQFDESTLFSRLCESGALNETHLDELARTIAEFHRNAAPQPSFSSAASVQKSVRDVLRNIIDANAQLPAPLHVPDFQHRLERLFERLGSLMASRQQTHVRLLHGDLHLQNICLWKGRPTLFDGIEFSDELASIDTYADLAFVLMDLEVRERRDAATCLLNRYLEITDDFDGLPLLDFYICYRALVRAMVELLAIGQHAENRSATLVQSVERYLKLANAKLRPSHPRVIAIGGLSGSGKSTLAAALARTRGAVIVRSDAVRKHLAAIPLHERAPESAYSASTTAATYQGAGERARRAVEAGFDVILDAVFGEKEQREQASSLARELGIPFRAIWCTVPPAVAAARVTARTGDVSDATLEVLARQLREKRCTEWPALSTEDSIASVAAKAQQIVSRDEAA